LVLVPASSILPNSQSNLLILQGNF
jgi:hypothetical protein